MIGNRNVRTQIRAQPTIDTIKPWQRMLGRLGSSFGSCLESRSCALTLVELCLEWSLEIASEGIFVSVSRKVGILGPVHLVRPGDLAQATLADRNAACMTNAVPQHTQ